ncbi:hypothetical protein HMPREF0454_03222 [Hafnia alvei ATCC 51873]|uniref:Uncharacterized protein n=1 Tax=Hafnia alvei ATCC 51873 TaxID=1002364 RepID=G9Y971_HAFAL|nr:hypothetical protein HMPREF0454_03222 [Hafnia alvei ATCC 51873]
MCAKFPEAERDKVNFAAISSIPVILQAACALAALARITN